MTTNQPAPIVHHPMPKYVMALLMLGRRVFILIANELGRIIDEEKQLQAESQERNRQ